MSPALTSPSVTLACRRTSLSTCRSDKPGWLSVRTSTLSVFNTFVCDVAMKSVDLMPSLFCSDHPGYCGGHHHPATHLPPEETSDCHRPYQRGQQVSLNPCLALCSVFPFWSLRKVIVIRMGTLLVTNPQRIITP